MDDEKAIKQDYLNGRLESIYAIERLEALGLLPKDAEKLIEQWDEKNA